MNNILRKLSAARLVLMALLFGSAASAAADKVYISDFGIKAGEQKEIAINFDGDASGIKYLRGKIDLPLGLELVDDAYGQKVRVRGDETRSPGATANMNPATGEVIIASSFSPFSGTSGAIGYFTVVSNRYLPEISHITVKEFVAVDAEGNETLLETFSPVVTRTTPLVWLTFTEDAQTIKSGDDAVVEVEMTNVVDVTLLQANISVSEGLRIVSIEPTDRIKGMSHENTDVYIFSGIDTDKLEGQIDGSQGKVFTIRLTSDKDFSGTATVSISKAVASEPSSQTHKPKDIVHTITIEPSFVPPVADGKYYVQNVQTGQFWGAANNWGTRASLVDEYQYVKLALQPNGTYTMESMVSNGGTSYYFGGDYMDGSAMKLTITKTDNGNYLFADPSGKLFGYDGSTTVLGKDVAAGEAAQWRLLTEADIQALIAERVKALSAATKKNPMDATFLVKDANFGRNRRDAYEVWTIEAGNRNIAGGGDDGNGCAESYMSTFTLSQTVNGLPNGIYKVEAQGAVTFHDNRTIKEYDGNGMPVVFAADKTSDFVEMIAEDRLTNMGQIARQFTAGMYEVEPLTVVVTDGTLTIGAKSDRSDIWAMWDNFRLTYLGPDYLVDPDTYYLQNVATGKFLAAGHDWGTRAIVNNAGLDYITAVTPEGKYTFDSQVSNGGQNHFLNADPLYNDQPAYGWTVAKSADGSFTISNANKQLLTVDADDNCALVGEADANAAWKFVTYEERVKGLEAATAQKPADATFIIRDANFGRNDLRKSAWEIVSGNPNLSGGENTNMAAEVYMSAYDIRQTVTGLPNGFYRVAAQGAVTFHDNRTIKEYDGNGYPVIFANDQTSNFTDMIEGDRLSNMNQICNQFSAGLYEVEPITVEVTDGTLTVGTKSDRADIWVMWDNFRVTYLGSGAKPDDPVKVAPEGWTALVSNGNLAGDDVSNYVSKEAPSADILPAKIVAGAGKNGSNGIVVKSADDPAQAWDTQFWIVLDQPLQAGTKLHVEFDYKADKAAKATTQAHGNPGAYQHWAAIGDVNFTTEWKTFSTDFEVSNDMATGSGGNGLLSIAFNLAEEKTATEYYFDNFGVWYEKPKPVEEWVNIIRNSDMEGAQADNYFKTEATVGPVPATFTDGIGKDGGRAILVQSADEPAQDWDTQFFIRLPFALPAGTKYKVSFDYKADKAGDFDTQAHTEPGGYIHWACIGSGTFTTDWQTYEAAGTISSDMSKEGQQMQTIAFNLAKNKVATGFIFDNVKFEVEKSFYDGIANDEAEKVAPEGWTAMVSNGNLAGDNISNYVSKEAPSENIYPARVVLGAGKNGSNGIVVKSADDPAQAWDTQFWIVLDEPLKAGSKLHVEFDYKADKAAKASTQAHGNPGAYQHWAAIGDVNFTTDWQTFSTDIEVSGDMAGANGMLSIAFNLAEEKTATEYYFDNFGVWAQKPVPVTDWVNLITNSDMEGDQADNFFKTEQGVGGPMPATFTDGIGKDGGRAIKVQSADEPAQDWDTQFFVRLPFSLPAGTKFKFSFDYRSSVEGGADTQSHHEPGQYIHWACAGSPNFTPEWQSYEYEGTVASECDGSDGSGFVKTFQTIAFNLAKNKVATEFIFDNVKFEIEKSVYETVGIKSVSNVLKFNDGAVYDLSGRKVEGTLRKGVYIQNGKKIMVK